MGKWLTVLLCAIKLYAGAVADSVTIRGQISGDGSYTPSWIQITPYSISENQPVKVKPGIYNDFILKVAAPVVQMYSVSDGKASYDFLVSPDESLLRLSVTVAHGQISDIRVSDSRQDEAFRAFLKIHSLYAPELKNMCLQCAGSDSCMKLFTPYYDKMVGLMKLFEPEYKGTYAANYLSKAHVIGYDTVTGGFNQYLKLHTLSPGLFSNPQFYTTPVPVDLIKDYFMCFSGSDMAENQLLIKRVMSLAGTNDTIKDILHHLVFTLFFTGGNEKMLDAYFQWCADNNLPDNAVLKAKIEALKELMPGNKLKEISLADTAGKAQSLSQVCLSHKLTLLVIWSPNCEHCQVEIPALIPLYQKYHSQGFEIYAAGVDAPTPQWARFVSGKKLPWINVWQFPFAQSNCLSTYAISYTPTYVLFDRTGKIISRFAHFEQLEKLIQNNIKE